LDDVAQAAGLSRQTIYLRYKNKENLFKSSISATLENSLRRCQDIASQDSTSIEDRIFEIFDIWCGQYIDVLKASPHASEIIDATHSLIGDFVKSKQDDLVSIITVILKFEGIPSLDEQKITPAQVAETIYYTAKGLMQHCENHEDFAAKMRTSITLLCKT
jgi:AcrR family transcriptional regulator